MRRSPSRTPGAFRLGGVRWWARDLGNAMDRQAAFLFPAHGGPDFPVEGCGDLLPGLQALSVWGGFGGGQGISGMRWTGRRRSFSQRMAVRTSRLRYAEISFQDSRRFPFGGASLVGKVSRECDGPAGGVPFPSAWRSGLPG